MDTIVSRRDAELGKPYRIVVGYDDTTHYYVQGILRSKNFRFQGERFWRVEALVMHHLIPVDAIREVLYEPRRYVL